MKTLREIANNHETRPESAGLELRLNLAEIVLVEMDRRGWNQKQLAEACGMKPAFIHRIIHSNSNCTFEVAGRIFFALGIKPRLIIKPIDVEQVASTDTPLVFTKGHTYVSTKRKQWQESVSTEPTGIYSDEVRISCT